MKVELSTQTTKKINATAKSWGERYVDQGISSNQLRRVYSEVKRAENEFRYEDNAEKAKQTLILMKPQLAYAAARSNEMEAVKNDISRYIDKAVDEDSVGAMEILFRLMEAIVAYHTYFEETGGR